MKIINDFVNKFKKLEIQKGGKKKMEKKIQQVVKPTIIRCVVCSKDKSARIEVMKKRIEKAGSEHKLRATYTCRDCKRKQKAESKAKKK